MVWYSPRDTMDLRQQRGQTIANTLPVSKMGEQWVVPSQSANGVYVVGKDRFGNAHCQCRDFDTTGQKCKHIFAVEFHTKQVKNPDGTVTVKQTTTITETIKKQNYKQDWPAYNAAQINEKEKFLNLLSALCTGIQEPEKAKKGRTPIARSVGLFAACFKVYSGFSARRFSTDLRECVGKGFLESTIHFNSVLNFLENPELTPVLKAMVIESSKPLSAVEVDFAGDSSGFTTCRYLRWFDKKYGTVKVEHDWVKVHLTCGVKTNIVTAVVIEGRDSSDTKQLPEMIETTAKNFTIKEYSADKAYGSLSNYEAIDKAGAVPFIPFKSNATGQSGGLWTKMFHYFNYRREDFLTHYHKRSNVESTFSMIKRKFGDFLRSKTDAAMVNEALCKIVCHNLVVLIHKMYELGIEPQF